MNREAPGQDAESSLIEHLLELRTPLVRVLADPGTLLPGVFAIIRPTCPPILWP